MLASRLSFARLALLAGVAVAADAGAQSTVPCCLRGTSQSLTRVNNVGSDADEKFFTVRGAPPNLMFVLDTSGSMRELPIEPNAASTRAQGTGCGNALYDAILTAKGFSMSNSYPPFDQGVDPANWNGDTGFPDLFQENSFYRYREWSTTTATARTAADACAATSNSAACQNCVTTKGYYLDPSSSSDSQQVFSGKFLNVYPPRYVAARTVLKRVVWNVQQVRMGLTVFDGSNGGKLISKMNPPCDKSLDPFSADWVNNRKALINEVNNPTKVSFSGRTPLAETLLNVGQYFTTDDSVYNNWFGGNGAWIKTEFRNDSITSESRSICYGCQVSSVVVITDGAPCGDNCVPECIKRQSMPGRPPGADQRDCGCNGSCPDRCGGGFNCANQSSSDCCSGAVNYLDRVAKWLYENDLQTKNPANGSWSADGRQRLVTYTVGFGLDHPLLASTAAAGGGQYFTSNDAASLEAALLTIVNDVNKRATTFGVSAISTLQQASGITSLVPRFIPGKPGEQWKGLLLRFGILSEAFNGCKPTTPPATPDPNDLDGDGKCETLFYTDKDGSIVEEDAVTGQFLKKGTNVPARPFWEAGRELTYVSPTYAEPETAPKRDPDTRNLWTVIDDNADGRVDRNDTLLAFTVANVDALMPYMGITLDASKDEVCQQLYTKMGITSPALSAWGKECAKVVIEYYRGHMSHDADPAKRTLTRDWLLHDIFHSSPVMVEPPINRDACGFFPHQCLASIYRHGDPKESANSIKAYGDYVTDPSGPCGGGVPCEQRPALVLVGTNGGFLHAFEAGRPKLPLKRDNFSNRYEYDLGTGREVWGFIPPDLLGTLKYHLDSHGYFVDGAPMVRDVWVDGAALNGGDGKKARDEFLTVAVVGERSGGTHFFALDVTRNIDSFAPLPPRPRFLWMWPQPCDPRVTLMGETWSNFFPKPPPIGPVLLDTTSGLASGGPYPGFDFRGRRHVKTNTPPWTDITTKARERWVVMLNGGYDRNFTRGRGFAMVDVYNGQTLWDPFFKEGDAVLGRLEYPLAAGVAMLDIGPGELRDFDIFDGFFDTLTIGDLGGNLFTARFYEPGIIDSSSQRVINWHFGRGFQTERDDGNNVRDRRGISFITSNALQRETGFLRSFFGTGDRNALLDTGGGICSLDNLGACIAMGCKVESKYRSKNVPSGELELKTKWENFALVEKKLRTKTCSASVCGGLTEDQWEDACEAFCDSSTCTSSAPCPTCAGEEACEDNFAALCPASCPNVCSESRLELDIKVENCPGTTVGPPKLEREVKVECVMSSGVLECKRKIEKNDTGTRTWTTAAQSSLVKHRYFGVHTFGGAAGDGGTSLRVFSDATSAADYDTNRLSEPDLTYLGALSTPSGAVAPVTGKGWYIDYDDISERTSSASGITFAQDLQSGCVLWNTLIPSTAGSICAGAGSQTNKFVQADYVTGAPSCARSFGLPDGGTQRYEIRTALVPPVEPTSVVMVVGGQVIHGVISANPGQNAKATVTAVDSDLVQSVFTLEHTEAEHICRHRDANACGR